MSLSKSWNQYYARRPTATARPSPACRSAKLKIMGQSARLDGDLRPTRKARSNPAPSRASRVQTYHHRRLHHRSRNLAWVYPARSRRVRWPDHWVLGIGTYPRPRGVSSPTSGFEDLKFNRLHVQIRRQVEHRLELGRDQPDVHHRARRPLPAGTVQATVKYGNNDKTGDILGPICYPRFGNFRAATSPSQGGWLADGWDADSTTFDICIQGPSYPNGNESEGACRAYRQQRVTWQGLQAGDYTVSETNPGAANWTVTGEGADGVPGRSAPRPSPTRKMNDVTVTQDSPTVYCAHQYLRVGHRQDRHPDAD